MARLAAFVFIGCLLGLSIAQVQPVKFKLNQGRPNQKRGPPTSRRGLPGPVGGKAGDDVKTDEKPRFASAVAAPPAGGMQPQPARAPPVAPKPAPPRPALRPSPGRNAAAKQQNTAQAPAGGAAPAGQNSAPPAGANVGPTAGGSGASGKKASAGGSQASTGQNAASASSGTAAGRGNSAAAAPKPAASAPAKPSLTPTEMVYYNQVLASLMQQYQPQPAPQAQPLPPMSTTYAPYQPTPYGYCNHQYGNSHNCACEYQECSLIGEKFSAASDGCGGDMHCCCDVQ